jgi:hypothetical protein
METVLFVNVVNTKEHWIKSLSISRIGLLMEIGKLWVYGHRRAWVGRPGKLLTISYRSGEMVLGAYQHKKQDFNVGLLMLFPRLFHRYSF